MRLQNLNLIETFKAQADTQPPGNLNQSATNPRYTSSFSDGYNLSPEGVAELENIVKKNPDNLEAQRSLLSYYSTHARDKSIRLKQERTVLWLIQNHPDDKSLGEMRGLIDPEGLQLR